MLKMIPKEELRQIITSALSEMINLKILESNVDFITDILITNVEQYFNNPPQRKEDDIPNQLTIFDAIKGNIQPERATGIININTNKDITE